MDSGVGLRVIPLVVVVVVVDRMPILLLLLLLLMLWIALELVVAAVRGEWGAIIST